MSAMETVAKDKDWSQHSAAAMKRPLATGRPGRDTDLVRREGVGGAPRDASPRWSRLPGLRPDPRRNDGSVPQLVFVAGVFHHTGWLPQAIDPDNEPSEFMGTLYGEVSPDGVGHYPVVVEKLARMHLIEPTLAPDDLGKISCRTLVMFGDDDEVPLGHAIALYRGLPNAELAIVPGTSHGLLVEKAALCNSMMIDFLTNDAVETLAPIRRGAGEVR